MSFMLCVCYCCHGSHCYLWSVHFPIGYHFVPRDNPQSACSSVLGVPPYAYGYLIVNTECVKYFLFEIGAGPKFF